MRADRAEVLPVSVDAEDVAEVARLDDLLQLLDARVVEQQVAGHQHETSLLREFAQLLHLARTHRRRLLDEDVLARFEGAARQLVVRRHRGRDHDRLDGVVGEQVVEAGRHPGPGVALRKSGPQLFVQVADPGELGQLVEVAGEVPSPLAQADLTDARHSFQTFSWFDPFLPVALRRSTTTCARSTRSS
jgi:hypothetical protein